MDTRFLRCLSGVACFLGLIGAWVAPASAQEGPKLYVFMFLVSAKSPGM